MLGYQPLSVRSRFTYRSRPCDLHPADSSRPTLRTIAKTRTTSNACMIIRSMLVSTNCGEAPLPRPFQVIERAGNPLFEPRATVYVLK